MTPERLVELMNLAAAVVAGVRVNLHTSFDAQKEYPHLAKIWETNHLLFNGELTASGRMYVDMEPTLSYELSTLAKQAHSDKILSSPEEYQRLRQGLSLIAKNMAYYIYKGLYIDDRVPGVVIDVGGGSGEWMKQFCRYHPRFSGVLIDSRPTTPTTRIYDVFANNQWVFDFPNPGVILLNEVLHLRGKIDRVRLFKECYQNLSPGGWLLIGERKPTPEFAWRMAAATSQGEALYVEQLIDEIEAEPTDFVIQSGWSHYFLMYLKPTMEKAR